MTWTDKKFAEVNGRRMAYVETGKLDGDPIVFLHGNPTSSYLWRNIFPYMTGLGRCIAPDLIGMGDSDKLPDSGPDRYRFVEHREYLFALLDAIGVSQNVTLVIHDWGSALGFDWANQHRDAVKGIAYMEAIVQSRTWDDFPERARPAFEAFRSPAGDKMVLEENFFVERMLTGSILRDLTDEEMTEYRRPFTTAGESRRPTLTWPRQIPIDGEPADVTAIVDEFAAWIATSEIPKLFINAEPGAILSEGPSRDFCRTWTNQTEVTVKGSHFIQEDSPDEIGQAIADWLTKLS
ncbi:MAG: haloalkane dehalogenase [Alphaproteobacteria bacterium]|nr:haloalkane dehalogenase [Alphaproteobacteria bacterium]MCZ6511704.1 haloalkane dehalogenase [Alphaproteobacteria bacterium]MCZ6841137.1 haloalkane dehalogenase [Alphaproteobacteria bacterium]MCZ6844908.1 haloalkane dehalogenase [Alphaproteobacteria bacterium]